MLNHLGHSAVCEIFHKPVMVDNLKAGCTLITKVTFLHFRWPLGQLTVTGPHATGPPQISFAAFSSNP